MAEDVFEKKIKDFFAQAGGGNVLNAMREHFTEVRVPANDLDAGYIQGRNSVILSLMRIVYAAEDKEN